MKRTLLGLVGLFIGFIMLVASPAPLFAAGGGPQFDFTPSSSSAKADGSSKITFSVFSYYYACDSGFASDGVTCSDGSAPYKKPGGLNLEYSVQVSGSGNSVGGTYTGSNGAPTFKIGSDGKASFTLASTVAESKTVKIYFTELNDPSHPKNPTTTVSFTTPPAAPAPKKTTPAPAAPVEPAPPAAPSTSSLVVGGQPVDGTTSIVVTEEKPLVLGGKTVPNGIVKLFIFSEPKEVTVTADAEGNWTYEVVGLEPGAHHVEAEVTDPATNKTSTRATLVAFEVAAPVAAETTAPAAKKDTKLWWFVAGGLLLLAAAGFATWWFWLRKKGVPPAPQMPTSTDVVVGTPMENDSSEQPPNQDNTPDQPNQN